MTKKIRITGYVALSSAHGVALIAFLVNLKFLVNWCIYVKSASVKKMNSDVIIIIIILVIIATFNQMYFLIISFVIKTILILKF